MQLKSVQYDKPHFSHAGQCGIGEAWARIPRELDRAQRLRTAERIRALLHERDAVLVAHYYVDGELQDLARETGGEVIYDWGGGLIWAALPPSVDAHAAPLRRRLAAIGGHATLLRADEGTRRAVDVFHPQAKGVAALSERVRQSFDPKSILNRGRLARTPIS